MPQAPSASATRANPKNAAGGDALRVTASGRTDVGRHRKHNEDHFVLRPKLGLFVVADGMGGHNAGDVASRLATTSIANFYEATQDGTLPNEPLEEDRDLPQEAQRLAAAVRKANRDVFEISSTYRQHKGMGSTIVACHVGQRSGLIHIGHVGDSRCYRVRNGHIEQLTRDHSLVNDALTLKPDLSEAELARLPKNIITRALGMKESVPIDTRTEEVLPGDVYLLCSDGLSGLVDDQQLLDVIVGANDLSAACGTLIDLANEAGGSDNITAVLVRVDEAETPPSSSPEVSNLPLESLPPDVAAMLEAGQEVTVGLGGDLPSDHVAHCSKCHAELQVGCLFCVMCGTPVRDEEASPVT